MAKNYKVIHKRSVVVEEGQPKLPTSAQTEYGEISINYADGYETLAIRNNADKIVPFSNDNTIKEWIENSKLQVIDSHAEFSALTESGYVVDAIVIKDYVDESEFVTASALNDLNNRINNLTDKVIETVSDFANLSESGYTVDGLVLKQVIEEDEEVAAEAFNDINQRIRTVSGTTSNLDSRVTALEGNPGISYIVHNGNYYEPYKEGNLNIIDIGNGIDYIKINGEFKDVRTGGSGNTYIDLGVLDVSGSVKEYIDKVTVRTIPEYAELSQSGSLVDAYVMRQVIRDNELAVASALNDLNDRVSGLSAATIEDEYITSRALNNLNDKIIELSGNSGSSELLEQLSGSVIELSGAVVELSAATIDNELITAEAINDLNDKIIELSGNSVSSELFEQLSGSVIQLSAATIQDEFVISQALNDLNERIDNVPIYSAVSQFINDAGYITEEDLEPLSGAVVELSDSLAELSGSVVESELVISQAFNEVNERINNIPTYDLGPLSGSVIDLSAATYEIEFVHSLAINDLNNKMSDLSASTENYVTANEVESQITNKHYTTTGDVETQITGKNYVTSGNVETQITGKKYVTSAQTKSQIESYGYTTNTGTITGINMNGASKGTSGVVNLGTVITAETQLSTATTGNGNAITNLSVSNHQITMTKGATFVTGITINESAATITNGSVNLGNYIPIEKEFTIASAFNDLNDRLLVLEEQVAMLIAWKDGGGDTPAIA